MEDRSKKVRRAEIILVVILFLVIFLFQLTGSPGRKKSGSGDGTDMITSAEDLNGATFSVVVGTPYDLMIKDHFKDPEILYVSDWAEECMQVAQGKTDALLWEKSSLNELYEMYPLLINMPEPIDSIQFSWCTVKDKRGSQLKEEVDSFIRQLESEGMLDEIYARWEDPDTAPDHADEYPMIGEPKGKLKVLSCLDWQPVIYENDGNACGFMIELLNRFCAQAGYTYTSEYTNASSLAAAFATGKYDLLVYGMETWDELKEVMNLTEPLMSDEVYAVVAKDRWAGSADPEGSGDDSVTETFKDRIAQLWDGLVTSFEKNFIRENRWKALLSGLGVTIALSALSIFFGTLAGGVICYMRMKGNVFAEAFARIYIRFVQGMPIVLMLLILYYLVFASFDVSAFWICVLGFSLDFSAYAGEMFRSGILAVPAGQQKAARALGFKPFESFRFIVFPQMVIHCIPVYMGQVISTVKLTSVAGYISVKDLTRVSDLIRARTYEAFFPLILTALIYFLVATLLIMMLGWLERRLDPARRSRRIKGVKEHAD